MAKVLGSSAAALTPIGASHSEHSAALPCDAACTSMSWMQPSQQERPQRRFRGTWTSWPYSSKQMTQETPACPPSSSASSC